MEDKCKSCGGPLYIKGTTFKVDKVTSLIVAVQSQYCPCATCSLFDVIACRKETPVPQEDE